MGFCSWETQDTNKSIPNVYSNKDTFTVYMKDDKGNVWKESAYQGYAVFGGKDYYDLFREMDGLEDRDEATKLAFDPKRNDNLKWPTLTEDKDAEVTGKPKECSFQGFFYDF